VGLRKLSRGEERAVQVSDVWGPEYTFASRSFSGVNVTQENALRCNAIFAAVHLISDAISMLPVGQFVRRSGAREPLYPRVVWLTEPDADGSTWQSFMKSWVVSKLIAQAACVRILRSDTDSVIGFALLDPRRVQRRQDAKGRIYYTVDNVHPVAKRDMIYDAELIPAGQLTGVSRVDLLRETFGLSQALENFAATFFGNGAHTNGVISVPEGVDMTQAKEIKDAWDASHKGIAKANGTGLLGGGATWQKTSVDPDEAQMIESREFAIGDIARAFRIPPTMLGSTKAGTQGYASREQDSLQFVTYTLMPYITAIEDHLSPLLPVTGAFVKFNVDGLLRASLTDRYAAHASGVDAGWLAINEARAREDLPPVAGGDEVRLPLENVPMSANAFTAQKMLVEMAQSLYEAGWEPAAILDYLGLPPIAHTGLPSVQTQQPQDPKETP